jgi:hypothetical protein
MAVHIMTLRALLSRLFLVPICLAGEIGCCGAEHVDATVLVGPTARGLFLVEVRSTPDLIPLNEPFELALTLRRGSGAGGQGLAGRTLLVEGWMPGHGHGMLRQSQVDDLGDGRYRVRGMLFHMPGAWELRVKVIETRIEDEFRVIEDDEVVFEVHL